MQVHGVGTTFVTYFNQISLNKFSVRILVERYMSECLSTLSIEL